MITKFYHDHGAVNKVAQVTFMFWLMKICATTVGETGGDLLSMTMNVGYGLSTLILLGFFFAVLVLQLKLKRFHPFLYWAVILATSTAGTTISDYMDQTLELGYATGSLIIAATLVMMLGLWKATMGSVSVSHINNPKVEIFYWLTILVSNTLGTALGDYLADSSGLGYGLSNLLISGAILTIALLYLFTPVSRTLLFWAAFVLTRPFGATMGDILTKAPEKGGLGYGTLGSSVILLAILVVLIVFDTKKNRMRTGH